ncbi:MAG: helix-turn-helix transcriptional regulator [Sciscionella sp.]
MREALASCDMGAVVSAYRTHPFHGRLITQEVAAGWVGITQSQLSRIERGDEITSLPKLRRWAQVLGIPAELLWFTAASEWPGGARRGNAVSLVGADAGPESLEGPDDDPVLSISWGHRGTVEASVALSDGRSRVKRRGFLFLTGAALTAPAHQWLVREPGPVVSGLSGGRVSAGLADRLPAMITELRRMDDVAGGGTVLSLAQHHFGWVAGLLDQASYTEPTGLRLHVALAELGQFAGWAAYDAGHHGLAQRYYIAALRAAHSADDRQLGAHILRSMAFQAAHQERPAEAVTLIETAVAGARGRETPSLLAELSIAKAMALATLKDDSACTAAISHARTHVERLKPDDTPSYLYWVNPAQIMVNAGNSLLQLGQADRAATMLDGVTLFDESFARDRQIYLTHLADAHARPGPQRDLDLAAGRGMEAIDLAESLDSPRGVGHLRDLYHQMRPYAQVPAVGDFVERARGFLAA